MLPSFHKSGGFTLIELVAAFVIFAIGFGVLLQILSTCLHTTAQAADYTRAALWAQSLLDVQGVGEPLQDGDFSGAFDDKYRWHLQVGQVPPQDIAPVASAVPVAVQVIVSSGCSAVFGQLTACAPAVTVTAVSAASPVFFTWYAQASGSPSGTPGPGGVRASVPLTVTPRTSMLAAYWPK